MARGMKRDCKMQNADHYSLLLKKQSAQLTVDSYQSAVISRQSAVGSRQSAINSQQSAVAVACHIIKQLHPVVKRIIFLGHDSFLLY